VVTSLERKPVSNLTIKVRDKASPAKLGLICWLRYGISVDTTQNTAVRNAVNAATSSSLICSHLQNRGVIGKI